MSVIFPEEEARAIADRLFEHYAQLSPLQRVMGGYESATDGKFQLIRVSVKKILNHVPLQYVLGKAWFMDMEFVVNKSVLIPRPETEEMVSLILKNLPSKESLRDFKILDIGTGSGCIAISLKKHIAESSVTAIDISGDALKVAATNAADNDVTIRFVEADILNQENWALLPESDLIVSNPPYVTVSEKKFMQPNVLDYEPHTALFVPDDDPLIFYRFIMAFAKDTLNPTGSLWFEINEKFGDKLKDIALNQGFSEANIFFDLRGKSRFLQCRKNRNSNTHPLILINQKHDRND